MSQFKSLYIILPTVVVMGVTVFVLIVTKSYIPRENVDILPELDVSTKQRLAKEGFQFRKIKEKFRFKKSDHGKSRSEAEYKARRAYRGAPPIIPHPVSETYFKGEECLTCHLDGGWVEKWSRYVPVTPHPEWKNCRQCHVNQTTKESFKSSDWKVRLEFSTPAKALLSSPPTIPHDLQYRQNCSSCHSGPGALKKIRTSHPERIHCRQCHVSSVVLNESDVMVRTSGDHK